MQECQNTLDWMNLKLPVNQMWCCLSQKLTRWPLIPLLCKTHSGLAQQPTAPANPHNHTLKAHPTSLFPPSAGTRTVFSIKQEWICSFYRWRLYGRMMSMFSLYFMTSYSKSWLIIFYYNMEICLFNLVDRSNISLRKRIIFVWVLSVINFRVRMRDIGPLR